jgi:hypothetical protein
MQKCERERDACTENNCLQVAKVQENTW